MSILTYQFIYDRYLAIHFFFSIYLLQINLWWKFWLWLGMMVHAWNLITWGMAFWILGQSGTLSQISFRTNLNNEKNTLVFFIKIHFLRFFLFCWMYSMKIMWKMCDLFLRNRKPFSMLVLYTYTLLLPVCDSIPTQDMVRSSFLVFTILVTV